MRGSAVGKKEKVTKSTVWSDKGRGTREKKEQAVRGRRFSKTSLPK